MKRRSKFRSNDKIKELQEADEIITRMDCGLERKKEREIEREREKTEMSDERKR